MNIKTPANSEDIFRRILDKCIKLIDLRYWDDIQKEDLLAWSKQFQTDADMFLASAILNSIIYRSKSAVESFGANVFHIILPSLLEDNGIYQVSDLDNWCEQLNNKSCLQLPFRFSTIEGIDKYPAKSGSVIYRALQRKYFDRSLGVNSSNYSNIPSHVNTIILFDDIMGTSEQFSSFINQHIENLEKIKVIYIPLAAHENGISLIESLYKNVIVSPVEILTDDNSFFSENNILFKDRLSIEEMKWLYEDFCKRKNIRIRNINGHGDMALTYCFYDSTPNNNLPILWYKSRDWSALFTR